MAVVKCIEFVKLNRKIRPNRAIRYTSMDWLKGKHNRYLNKIFQVVRTIFVVHELTQNQKLDTM